VALDGGGRPYHHRVAVADAVQRSGVDVVLHTATDVSSPHKTFASDVSGLRELATSVTSSYGIA
jgi:hypothetical protein